MRGGVSEADPSQEKPHQAPVSPRSGAEPAKPHRWAKGQSGNPAGSSAKQRFKSAIEKACTSETADQVLAAVLVAARDPNSPLASSAWQWLARTIGLQEADKPLQVVVTTEIEVCDRSDGTRPKIEVRNVTTSSGGSSSVTSGDDNSIEVEV